MLDLVRDSADEDVRAAYKKVSRKCHPDRGGNHEHQLELNVAHDAWQDARKSAEANRARAKKDATASSSGGVAQIDRAPAHQKLTFDTRQRARGLNARCESWSE